VDSSIARLTTRRDGILSFSVRLLASSLFDAILRDAARWSHGLRILVSSNETPLSDLLASYLKLLFVRILQFLVSPYIGSLSDKYGRKKILLITMIGNILSALVCVGYTCSGSWRPWRARLIFCSCSCSWVKSTTFASYMLSRVIGGLSEGNVQLAMYVILILRVHRDLRWRG